MVVILILFSPYIFEVIFGDGWQVSGIFVQILAPMFGIRLVVSTFTPALIIVGKQKIELIIQSAFIIISILSFIICRIYNYDIHIFLTIITVSYSIIYLILYVIIYRFSVNNKEDNYD